MNTGTVQCAVNWYPLFNIAVESAVIFVRIHKDWGHGEKAEEGENHRTGSQKGNKSCMELIKVQGEPN